VQERRGCRRPGGDDEHHERGGHRRPGGSRGAEESPEGGGRSARTTRPRTSWLRRPRGSRGWRRSSGRSGRRRRRALRRNGSARPDRRRQLQHEAELVASRHVFGGGRVAENIRSLHRAFRGGQRDERTRGGRAGAPAINFFLFLSMPHCKRARARVKAVEFQSQANQRRPLAASPHSRRRVLRPQGHTLCQ